MTKRSTPDDDFDSVRALVQCSVCGLLPLRPLFFPQCHHSPMCEPCVVATKPSSCPICDTPRRTPIAKLPRNKTLELVLRRQFPEDYEDRPHTDALLSDIECNKSISSLKESIEVWHKDLREDYLSNASAIIRAHHGQSGTGKTPLVVWCQCKPGLVCVPKASQKRKRWFYGCPRWSPAQVGDVAPSCKLFKWLSEKQCEVLALAPVT